MAPNAHGGKGGAQGVSETGGMKFSGEERSALKGFCALRGAGWEKVEEFETWKDKYDPDGPGPSEWTSRFKPHSVKRDSGSLLDGNYESDFDPFDDKYKDGYLKA